MFFMNIKSFKNFKHNKNKCKLQLISFKLFMKQIYFNTCIFFSNNLRKKNPSYLKKNKITDNSLLRKTFGN